MIKNIFIKNITNFKEANINLSNINILIGDHGSGKSNIINAFRLMKNLTGMPLKEAMSNVYGYVECNRYWALDSREPSEIQVEFEDGTKYYVKIEGQLTPIITEERIVDENNELIYEGGNGESILTLKHLNGYKNNKIELLVENLRDMEFHLKGFDKEVTAKILGRLMVSEIRDETLNMIKIAYRNIEDIEVRLDNHGRMETFVVEKRGRILSWKMLSSGVAKYLGLIATLMNPSRRKMIFIENPDAFLHPDLMVDLAVLFAKGSVGSKIIMTTHSPYLLDAIQDCVDSILVLNREGGNEGTKVEKIDLEKIDEWLDKYSLGELWEKGYLGGNVW